MGKSLIIKIIILIIAGSGLGGWFSESNYWIDNPIPRLRGKFLAKME
jgi:hypothetical protein